MITLDVLNIPYLAESVKYLTSHQLYHKTNDILGNQNTKEPKEPHYNFP